MVDTVGVAAVVMTAGGEDSRDIATGEVDKDVSKCITWWGNAAKSLSDVNAVSVMVMVEMAIFGAVVSSQKESDGTDSGCLSVGQ